MPIQEGLRRFLSRFSTQETQTPAAPTIPEADRDQNPWISQYIEQKGEEPLTARDINIATGKRLSNTQRRRIYVLTGIQVLHMNSPLTTEEFERACEVTGRVDPQKSERLRGAVERRWHPERYSGTSEGQTEPTALEQTLTGRENELYQLMRRETPYQALVDSMFPGKPTDKQRSYFQQLHTRLKAKLVPRGEAVVNIGGWRTSDYRIVELGQEEETKEAALAAREEEALRQREAQVAERHQGRKPKEKALREIKPKKLTKVEKLLGFFPEGTSFSIDDVIEKVWAGGETQYTRKAAHRIVRQAWTLLETQGERIIRIPDGRRAIFTRVKIDSPTDQAEIQQVEPLLPAEPQTVPTNEDHETGIEETTSPKVPAKRQWDRPLWGRRRVIPSPQEIEEEDVIEVDEISTGEDILLEEDVEEKVQRPFVETSSIALRLPREEQRRLADALVDFNGQYVLEELDAKLTTEDLGTLRRVAHSEERLLYSEEKGRKLQMILNAAATNPREFLAQNGNRKWLSSAIRKLSRDESRGPGDVFWEIYYSMRPRPIPR